MGATRQTPGIAVQASEVKGILLRLLRIGACKRRKIALSSGRSVADFTAAAAAEPQQQRPKKHEPHPTRARNHTCSGESNVDTLIRA